MAPSWQSYRTLRDSRLHVAWSDFTRLWQSFTSIYSVENHRASSSKDTEVVPQDKLISVQPKGTWGVQLQAIAESDASELEKNKQTAQLCWCIFSTVRFGQKDVIEDAPWENEDAKVWRDADKCPSICVRKKVPSELRAAVCSGQGRHPYSKVILGTQIRDRQGERVRAPIELSLHRFACWLANGNPDARLKLATHLCGHKLCLRLGCLRWGDHKTNADDLAELMGGLSVSRRR